MAKRATVKDIAELAGVSLGTVHYALSGKAGVSERTRSRIFDIAKQLDYQPNSNASALKRKQLTIAAAFPHASGESRYFYSDVWAGIKTMLNSARDYNIRYIELPYQASLRGSGNELNDLLGDTAVDGIVTQGYSDERGEIDLSRIIEKNIPVALVANDISFPSRLCCVQSDCLVVGRMLAEYLSRLIPPDGEVLISAGDATVPSQYLIVDGFEAYLRENHCSIRTHRVYSQGSRQRIIDSMVEVFNQNNIAACFCVNARSSPLLAQGIIRSGRKNKVIAVGSDIFRENCSFLREGVFTNLMNKNAFMQAYIATKCLIEFLLRNTRPPEDTILIKSEIVFQSNIQMYEEGQAWRLL